MAEIYVRGEAGVVWEMDDATLSESMSQRLTDGRLTRVNRDGSPYVETVHSEDSQVVDESTIEPAVKRDPLDFTARPAHGEPKSAWVAFAVSRGLSVNEAEGMTKAELVADRRLAELPA